MHEYTYINRYIHTCVYVTYPNRGQTKYSQLLLASLLTESLQMLYSRFCPSTVIKKRNHVNKLCIPVKNQRAIVTLNTSQEPFTRATRSYTGGWSDKIFLDPVWGSISTCPVQPIKLGILILLPCKASNTFEEFIGVLVLTRASTISKYRVTVSIKCVTYERELLKPSTGKPG